jgi:putative resolvase
MRATYPGYTIVGDVGSGINFKRRGPRSVLERSMRGEVAEVVVAHRDRLARFGVDLIEWILQRNGTRLVVQHSTVGTPESELADDLLSIVTVFACRRNGTRRYKAPEIQEAQGVR